MTELRERPEVESAAPRTDRRGTPSRVPRAVTGWARSPGGKTVLRACISFGSVLILWYVGTKIWHNPLAWASPEDVVRAGRESIESGTLVRDMQTSAIEFGVGFAIATVVGILIGIAMGLSDRLNAYLDPLVAFLYATPTVAVAPLFITIMGIGLTSKIAVSFLVAVIPILVSTNSGIRSVERKLLDMATAFGATPSFMVRTVYLPYAAPSLVTGLRLGVGKAIVGVTVGEIFGSTSGLGNMLYLATQRFDVPTVFLAILVLGLWGYLFTALLQAVENRVGRWRRAGH